MNGREAAETGKGASLALALVLFAAAPLHAAGTPAGTAIVNTARLTYDDEHGQRREVDSNAAALTVDERIDVVLSSLDGGQVAVAPGDKGRVLSFRLLNAGNAPEAFALNGIANLSGDQWDPSITALAIDSNGNGQFDPGVDQSYRPGIDDPMLAADASVTLFVIGDVPAGIGDGAVGLAALRATAVTGSGRPGTVFAGKGEGGVDAVIGGTGASATAQGGLIASLAMPQLVKSQDVRAPDGSGSAVAGALITYTLTASYGGSLPSSGGLIEDPIPAGTSYVPGSLKLNGAALSDAADGDAGSADARAIRVEIGALAKGASATVTFQVRVDN